MWDIFVYDLVATIKVCQGDLYNMYCDYTSKFALDSFWSFKYLLDCKHDSIYMQWIPNVNIRVCHLAFKVFGNHIWAMHQDLGAMVASFLTQYLFVVVESLVETNA
jgi:hypothetical protein